MISVHLREPLSRRVLHMLVLVAVSLAALAMTAPAAAQGTMGLLPDPITTRELEDFAMRLRLSSQQRKAVEDLHDQYKREFRELRETEIADFMKSMMNMQGGMPTRQTVEEMIDRMTKIRKQIELVDSRLFDRMQPMLIDEQLIMLPRVRLARERTRLASQQMMWLAGGAPPDLSAMVFELDLTPEQMQVIDPTLAGYESRLTATMVKMQDATSKMFLAMMDAMESAGITQETVEDSDPEVAAKVEEAMQQIFESVTTEIMTLSSDLAQQNRRTCRSLMSMLPQEQGRSLRDALYRRAYVEARFALPNDTMFPAALKLDDLTDEQRDMLRAAQQQFYSSMDQLLERIVDYLDEFNRSGSPFDFAREHWEEKNKKLEESRARATEIRAAAVQDVTNILGAELTKKIQPHIAAMQSGALDVMAEVLADAMEAGHAAAGEGAATDEPGDGGAIAIEESQAMVWSGNQWLPPQISHQDLNEYAAILKLSEEHYAVLQHLYKSYVEAFGRIRSTEIAAVSSAAQSMWQWDETTGQRRAPAGETAEQLYRLRQQAMQAIRDADEAFFNDVEVTLISEAQAQQMKRVRMMRERARCRQGSTMRQWFSPQSAEATVDLMQMIRRLRLPEDTLQKIGSQLHRYEVAVTPLLRRYYESTLRVQQAQDQWIIEINRNAEEGVSSASTAARYRERFEEPTRQASEISRELARINRETLEQILEAIDSDAAFEFRAAYNREAFPTVYNDPVCIDRHLNEARKLSDLTDDQQRMLDELAVEYHPAYRDFCEQLIKIHAETEENAFWYTSMEDDPDRQRRWMERMEAIAKLNFDRSELNARAVSRLKSILSEEQIRRIGGLPELPQNTFNMW